MIKSAIKVITVTVFFMADFVAKVGYGGWMPVSHSTIDDRL